MYCRYCGKEIENDVVACPYCGGEGKKAVETSHRKKPNWSNKGALGFWLGIFFGLIGLIIGVCMYPSGSEERDTFVGGWLKHLLLYAVLIGTVLCVLMVANVLL